MTSFANKKVGFEFIVYGGSVVSNGLSILILTIIYAKFFTVEVFGILGVYLVIGMLCNIFFESQAISGFMRNYYHAKQERNESILLTSIILYYLLTGVGAMLLLWICLSIYQSGLKAVLGYHFYISWLLPIVFGVFPSQMYEILLLNLRLEGQCLAFASVSIFQSFFVILITLALVTKLDCGAEGALWAVTLSKLVCLLICFYLNRKRIVRKVSLAYVKSSLAYGLPLLPAVIAGWVISNQSRFIVMNYFSPHTLGVYSFVLRIGAIILLALQSIRFVWEPYLLKLFLKEKKEIIASLEKALKLYLALGMFVFFLASILSPLIFDLFGTKEYQAEYRYLPVVMFALLWQGSLMILNAGASWRRWTYLNTVAVVVGGAASLAASWLFAKQHEIYGVYVSLVLGYIIVVLLSRFFSALCLKVKQSFSNILFYLTLGSSYLFMLFYLNKQMTLFSYYMVTSVYLIFSFSIACILFFKNKKILNNIIS